MKNLHKEVKKKQNFHYSRTRRRISMAIQDLAKVFGESCWEEWCLNLNKPISAFKFLLFFYVQWNAIF
jgi:hypothetical protein